MYFLQNYLSHMAPGERRQFQEEARDRVRRAKRGALFVLIDLGYNGSMTAMRELAAVPPEGCQVVHTNVYAPEPARTEFTGLPRAARRIFTGEDKLVPKRWTNYYYLVLQKQ